jgi:hypothetical protein
VPVLSFAFSSALWAIASEGTANDNAIIAKSAPPAHVTLLGPFMIYSLISCH